MRRTLIIIIMIVKFILMIMMMMMMIIIIIIIFVIIILVESTPTSYIKIMLYQFSTNSMSQPEFLTVFYPFRGLT